MIMKKFIYIALLSLGFAFTSCEKDEVGGTATEATAGQWYVTCSAVDENNNLLYSDDDLYGVGKFLLLTYNTSDNNPNEMFIDDKKNFWDFKCKVSCDQKSLTFASNGAAEDLQNGIEVTITDGKILPGAGVQNNGSATDSISFYVVFSNDKYVGSVYSKLHIAGVRYSGLTEND